MNISHDHDLLERLMTIVSDRQPISIPELLSSAQEYANKAEARLAMMHLIQNGYIELDLGMKCVIKK